MSLDDDFLNEQDAEQELLNDQCNNHEEITVSGSNDERAALFGSLAKCQGELQKATRSSTADTGKFSYNYSTIGEILDVARKPMAENGLCIIQMPSMQDKKISVVTVLGHEKGGSIQSALTIPVVVPTNTSGQPSMNEAQACGSVITYARRYQLAGFLGISQEDSDAHGSSKGGATRMASEKQQNLIKVLIGKNWNWNDFGDKYKVERLDQLTIGQAGDAISHLQQMVKPAGSQDNES